MPKPYSQDLRQKVIDAIELDGMKRCEVAQLFGVSRNSINLWFQHKAKTGSLEPKKRETQGHSHKITDWNEFRRFVRKHHDKTQAQLAELWPEPISARTIGRGLKKIGFTRKKKSYGYRERDEQKRAAFRKRVEPVLPEDLVFADEAGMDNRDEYGYGYSPKGERIEALKSGRRSGRINMIAAYCKKTLLAPFTVEGSCNREVFETWIETCLVPVLKPGQQLIIDNASFHKGGRIEELVQEAGCEVWYLPPYSPDMNKIEHCWSWIKSRVRQCLNEFDSLRDAMEHVLRQAS